jgi:hypothetical protein
MNTTTTTIIQESMNLYQVFATGGASALAVVALLGTLKFLQSRHHIVSKCTKEGITLVADTNTPRIQNILHTVDEQASTTTGTCLRRESGQSAPVEGGDGSGVCGTQESKSEPNKEDGKENAESRVQEGSDAAPS